MAEELRDLGQITNEQVRRLFGAEGAEARSRFVARSLHFTIRPGIHPIVPILLGDQTAKRAQTLANLVDRDLKLRAMAPRARAFVPID